MNTKLHDENVDFLFDAILTLKNREECYKFFEDLCTVAELRAMEQRFEVAKMLRQEKVYTEIMQKTNASSATISRVNRMMNYGTGCLGEVLDRLPDDEDEEEK